MDINILLSFLAAAGGIEGLKYFLNLATNKRKANASAKSDEVNADRFEFDLLKEQIKFQHEEITIYRDQVKSERERCKEKSQKIEQLYDDIREKDVQYNRLLSHCNQLELIAQEADFNKCNVINCLYREPPRDKELIKSV